MGWHWGGRQQLQDAGWQNAAEAQRGRGRGGRCRGAPGMEAAEVSEMET